MRCQLDHDGCKKQQKKEDYRQAKRKFPNIDNPLSDWKCTEEEEKTCPQFNPYPPKMTEEEFNTRQIALLKDIPIEFRPCLSHMAWERGHAYGYEEVTSILSDFVSDMQAPISAFEKRIMGYYRE